MFLRSFLLQFISEKDRQHPDDYRRGELFIYSMFFFLLLIISCLPYFFITGYGGPIMLWANIASLGVIAITVWLYKKFGHRLLLVNIFIFLGHSSMLGTYDTGGGVYSVEPYFGLVMCAWIFLVGGKKSGLAWFTIAITTVGFFYYADHAGWKDFRADTLAADNIYYFMSFFFTGTMLALIITLYDNGKTKYVNQVIAAKAELETKSREIETKKEEIISSINYAKRIQQAILPAEDTIYRTVPLSFILYRPRDIVSGDFFWFYEIDQNSYIIVCADCTGHGVPGAFMTVIGSNLLTQIVTESRITRPAEVMAELDRRIIQTLRQQKEHYQVVQDGMDLAMLKVDRTKNELVFTSAKRPAIFIRDKEICELKGSKNTLGGLRTCEKRFEEITINYRENDIIYLFTDGYTDQFGGPENKKYMIRRFREQLLAMHMLPMHEQRQKLNDTITDWIGANEQTDDILVMGIRF
jgi:serine phosphatase RsbU (regulator of sigma subunit)